jgi:CTP synthase
LCKYAGAGDKIFSPHNDSGILDAGDIESMPFIEALGQFSYRVGKKTTAFF